MVYFVFSCLYLLWKTWLIINFTFFRCAHVTCDYIPGLLFVTDKLINLESFCKVLRINNLIILSVRFAINIKYRELFRHWFCLLRTTRNYRLNSSFNTTINFPLALKVDGLKLVTDLEVPEHLRVYSGLALI